MKSERTLNPSKEPLNNNFTKGSIIRNVKMVSTTYKAFNRKTPANRKKYRERNDLECDAILDYRLKKRSCTRCAHNSLKLFSYKTI